MVSGTLSVCFSATIKRARISLGVRNYAANDEGSEQVEALVITMLRQLSEITEVVSLGDNLERDVRKWLSPPDPWKNHNISCELRHQGSAAWFVQGNTFFEWKASEIPGSLLWVHGKRPLALNSYTSPKTEISSLW